MMASDTRRAGNALADRTHHRAAGGQPDWDVVVAGFATFTNDLGAALNQIGEQLRQLAAQFATIGELRQSWRLPPTTGTWS